MSTLVNTVSVMAGEIATLLDLGFTTIEIFETSGADNEVVEITAPSAEPARVSSKKASYFRVGGMTLAFSLDGGEAQSVTFSPVFADWTPAQVVSAIEAAVPGVASVVDGTVVLRTLSSGRASSLEVTQGAAFFGFPTGIVYGKDQRPALVAEQTLYVYFDVSGSSLSRYQWRYSDNGANPVSKVSPLAAGSQAPLSDVPVSLATARFTTIDGRPARTTIIVAPEVGSVGSRFVDGGSRLYTADENGFLQFPLAQGARVCVAVEGTSLVRVITVPATPAFDLMSALSDVADPFTVQTTPPLLTRRSL